VLHCAALFPERVCAGFHAVGKFAAVKIIVFATYYQSLLVALIPGMDVLGEWWSWWEPAAAATVHHRLCIPTSTDHLSSSRAIWLPACLNTSIWLRPHLPAWLRPRLPSCRLL